MRAQSKRAHEMHRKWASCWSGSGHCPAREGCGAPHMHGHGPCCSPRPACHQNSLAPVGPWAATLLWDTVKFNIPRRGTRSVWAPSQPQRNQRLLGKTNSTPLGPAAIGTGCLAEQTTRLSSSEATGPSQTPRCSQTPTSS